MSLSHFDEKSGIVACKTPWGKWWQTMSEIFVEIDVPEGTRGKECTVTTKPNFIECKVRGKPIFQGELFKTIVVEDCTWTVEERKRLVILLTKSEKFSNENMWESFLTNQYMPEPVLREEMMKKLDLEKFQTENPGFDFSGAKLSKSY